MLRATSVKAVMCLAVASLFAVGGIAEEAKQEKSPLFTLKTPKGENYSLEKNIGKAPIVINFWATWCGPCILEMKNMKKMYPKFSAKGVQFLSITIDDNKTQPQVPGVVKTYNFPYTILLDGNKEVYKAFHGVNPPNLFVIDTLGNIVYKHTGYQKGDEKKLESVLTKLVGDKK
jgi:peroxiredoxin